MRSGFRFLLFNMRYGSGAENNFHFPFPMAGYLRPTRVNVARIVEFLRGQDPDLVGLVEVDAGSSLRCDGRSQADEIARQLGHYHCYHSKYGPRSLARALPMLSKQGNAVLTRESIKAVTCHYFRRGVKRLVQEVDLKEMRIFLVHLSLGYRHRHDQLRSLYELVRAVDGKPVIVAGDFNTLSDAQELDLFLAATGLRSAAPPEVRTWPSRRPRLQLDFILHSPQIEVLNCEVPPVRLSDHLPLVCDLRLRG
jgi:endonuclease/exonuclease/phosphatase family metal-dependent hydrolase